MLIRLKPGWVLSRAAATPKALYRSRRELLALAGGALAASTLPLPALAATSPTHPYAKLPGSVYDSSEALTKAKDAKSYCNFYEFGTGKGDPAREAHRMTTAPWSITVDGLCDNPQELDLQDILSWAPLEERVYRLRCVEAWSMVIPWIGFPLAALLERARPKPEAKYVAFETYLNEREMPGTRPNWFGGTVLEWPYREGLRLDEAMHPLTLLAVGMYDAPLPNQNGAPIRLVVPWKYGFKSIKSIVRLRLTDTQPATSWNMSAPREYGFYSNVNPEVDHPRWSQKRERRIGPDGITRIDTLKFNGYGEWVATLYAGTDLKTNY